MKQYINKADLVAKIRRRFDEYSTSILKHYDAYKEAVEAALKYSLENVI